MNIFKGLELYGLTETDVSIYSDGEHVDLVHQSIIEKEALYEKTYICPICKNRFKDKMVRTARQRVLKVESDLRPVYDYFEMYKYDIVVCTKCGHSALNSIFGQISPVQQRLVLEKISRHFKPVTYPEVYNIETAILRYKLALLNSVVKNAPVMEKAVLCLKLRWLYEAKLEKALMLDKTEELEKIIEEDKSQLRGITVEALKGFSDAFINGNVNSYGFDESKVTYIIGELSFVLGKLVEAREWMGRVVHGVTTNHRLKEKAKERLSDIKTIKS